MIADETFFEIPLNTRQRSTCSPADPGPHWRGILIQAPQRAAFGRGQRAAFAAIPICGIYTLDLADLAKGEPMRLVAVDRATRRAYSGAVIDEDHSPEEPPPDAKPLDPKSLEGLATGSYFNLNLASYVGLPARSATYDIVVEYGGKRSNVVSIELIEEH